MFLFPAGRLVWKGIYPFTCSPHAGRIYEKQKEKLLR